MKPHKCWVVPAGFKTNLIRRYWVKNSSAFNFRFSSYWKSSMLGVLEEPGDNEFWHANSVCLSIFVNLMRKFKSSCKALSFLSRERWSPLILWDRIKGVDNHRFDGDQICTLLRILRDFKISKCLSVQSKIWVGKCWFFLRNENKF